MRKPKNLSNYSPVSVAAAQLRALADDLSARSREGDLMTWYINVRMWNPAWETPPKKARPKARTA